MKRISIGASVQLALLVTFGILRGPQFAIAQDDKAQQGNLGSVNLLFPCLGEA